VGEQAAGEGQGVIFGREVVVDDDVHS
jgi:hypothetical protein